MLTGVELHPAVAERLARLAPDQRAAATAAPGPVPQARIAALPMLQDVTSDLQVKSPQLLVNVDRDRAASLSVTSERIRDTLYSAFGSRQVATIYTSSNNYEVIMELAPHFRQDPGALRHLYVRNTLIIIVGRTSRMFSTTLSTLSAKAIWLPVIKATW